MITTINNTDNNNVMTIKINLLYLNIYIGAKSPHLLNMKRKILLNVGWKCHFQFSQLSQLHEWNFFQLSEWKNYCHFLWLSIYLLLHSINLYTPKTFSARVISKSNFFQLGHTSWLPHVVEILLLGFSFYTWKISNSNKVSYYQLYHIL